MVGAVGELVGALAVVGSLVYVGRQMKQNTAAVRGATYLSIGQWIGHTYSQWADSDRIPGLIQQFSGEGKKLSDFTPEDQTRIRLLLLAAVRGVETIHIQVQQGTLPSDAHDYMGGSWLHLPIAREVWPQIHADLSPAFVDYLESKYPLRSDE